MRGLDADSRRRPPPPRFLGVLEDNSPPLASAPAHLGATGVCVRPLSEAAVYAALAATSGLSAAADFPGSNFSSVFPVRHQGWTRLGGPCCTGKPLLTRPTLPSPLVWRPPGLGSGKLERERANWGARHFFGCFCFLFHPAGPTQPPWSSAHYHVLQSQTSKSSPQTCILTCPDSPGFLSQPVHSRTHVP